MKTRTALISIIILIIIIIITIFFQFKTQDITKTPEGLLIHSISKGKLKLAETFQVGEGLSDKLTGLVLENTDNPKNKNIAFTDNKAQYLLDGTLFSSAGKDLTKTYTEIYNPAPAKKTQADVSSNLKKLDENFLSDLKNSTFTVFQGDKSAPKTLTIFMDPNCPWCHRDFEELQSFIKSKKVSVNWVVVGILKNSSSRKTAAILSSTDPIAALQYNSKHFDEPNENGGVTEQLYPVSKEGAHKAKENLNFFIKQKLQAVPLLIYTNQQGHTMLFEGYAGADQLEQIIGKIKDN